MGCSLLIPFRRLPTKKRLNAYRSGFNGMEKDDEVKGSGNSYTTLFRQGDPRLATWLTLDPERAKFPWQSPYSYTNRNPLILKDPFGNTVKGATTKDASKIVKELNKIFPPKIVERFFTISKGGKTFNSLKGRRNEFTRALKGAGLNSKTKALANGFRKLVNSKAEITVQFKKGNITESKFEPNTATKGTVTIYDNGTPEFFEAQTISGKRIKQQFTVTQVFVHELLGEAFFAADGTKDLRTIQKQENKFKSTLEWLRDPILRLNNLRVIQAENLYNSRNGFYRTGLITDPTGSTHGILPEDIEKVKNIPDGFRSPYESPGGFGGGGK